MRRTQLALLFGALLTTISTTATASQPPGNWQAEEKAYWAKVDEELAAMETNSEKAARVLRSGIHPANQSQVFSRLIELPCPETLAFYRKTIVENENAWLRQLAAVGLGQLGEPEDAALLKKVAAEDPDTMMRSGFSPVMTDNARKAARMALEKLAERFPEKADGWLGGP